MNYNYTEWLPDLPDLNNPGLVMAKNCVPHGIGYQPFYDLETTTTALDGEVRGGISVRSKIGDYYTYAGDPTKLYEMEADVATDVSKVGGYSLLSNSYWAFDQFGDYVVGVAIDEATQSLSIGGANFADLAGSPPQARYIANVKGFAVVGNTWDATDGEVDKRVRWSAFEDITGWTTGTDMSDFQDLAGNGGQITAVVGGEYGVIFQERAIWRMTFEGLPTIFRFDKVETERGTFYPRSVAQVGHLIYYIGHDGFYAFDGNQSYNIGKNKVDEWFFKDLDDAQADRVTSTVDPIRSQVVWSYVSNNSVDGKPDKLIIFDYVDNKWTTVDIRLQMLVPALSWSYTLDELDQVNTNVDALPASLDSRMWRGGDPVFAAFNSDNELCTFTGPALDATFISGEIQFVPGARTFLSSVRPHCDGTPTVIIGSRDTQQEAEVYTPSVAMNDIGEANFRVDARYHRIQIDTTGWTESQGFQYNAAPSGAR
jgi:hypothetical protein